MSTPAQITANTMNAQSSTGPRTPEGLAASSKNATTNGLFATHDFIRPGEQEMYDELNARLFENLAPQGILECNLADEIRRAMWRLRRCGLIEESLAQNLAQCADSAGLDAMQVEALAKLQTSVDRARSQAHRLLHKSTAELRKLQTERVYRNESFDEGTDVAHLGISDWPSIETRIQKTYARNYRQRKAEASDEMEAYLSAAVAIPEQLAPFCKSTESPAPPTARAA